MEAKEEDTVDPPVSSQVHRPMVRVFNAFATVYYDFGWAVVVA